MASNFRNFSKTSSSFFPMSAAIEGISKSFSSENSVVGISLNLFPSGNVEEPDDVIGLSFL